MEKTKAKSSTVIIETIFEDVNEIILHYIIR